MFDSLSYTSKDIKAIRNEIVEFIKRNNDDWSDFNESSLQMQYMEMLAGVADMLCYYLDSQALETFLTSARQKKNINSILRSMNYDFEVIGPSKGEVVFTRIPHEMDENGDPIYLMERYKIPKYLKLWTDKKINFLTTETVSLPESSMSIYVPIVQGDLVRKAFPVETVRSSFKLQVSDKAIPLEYVEIENSGFEKVEDAFVLTKGGPYYSVHYDSYDNVYILFTFDWKKYLPETGDIAVRYIDTLGKGGNISQDLIVNFEDNIMYMDNITRDVELKVTNPSATYGGFSDVDLGKHVANAKDWLRTHDTIVLLSDFETMIRKESWVRDCVCFDWRKDDTIVQYPYQIKAWVVSIEGPELSLTQLKYLINKLQNKTVVMNKVEIRNADYVEVDINAKLSIQGSNESSKEEVRQLVEDTLKKWYGWGNYIKGDSESKLEFGLKIDSTKLLYDIIRLASSITGADISLKENINLGKTEFLYCNNIKVEIES